MNADRLIEHYERIADAPDAIPRLRKFILGLAVRGKLVPQDPNDKPVSQLLKAPPVRFGVEPFAVPATWAWVSIDAVAEARLGKMLDKAKNKGTPRRYLRNVNVRWFDFDLSDILEMPFEDSELLEFGLRAGDVLICEGGEPGRAAVWDERESNIYFQKAIHRVRFSEVVDPHYFVTALRASANDGRLTEYFTGTGIKHFTGKGLATYLFPLPPLNEQRYIIAKVDELMALCDQLEIAQKNREATRDRLITASLARLRAPDQDRAGFVNHARFTLENLAAITARPERIKQLRKTILNLAVAGKLVPQNPTEEPAAALLERIEAEKALMAHRGGVRKGKPSATASDLQLDLPSGWAVATLENVCLSVTDGDHLPPPKSEVGVPFLVIGNVRMQKLDFTGCRFVPKTYFDSLDPTRRPQVGDLLYTLVGSYGIPVAVSDQRPFCVQRHIGILRPSKLIELRFLLRAMESDLVFDQATACATGIAQKTVPLAGLRRITIPLPSVAEQRRITAKVDELMALCDQLEASLVAGDDHRRRLLDALLAEALAPVEIETV